MVSPKTLFCPAISNSVNNLNIINCQLKDSVNLAKDKRTLTTGAFASTEDKKSTEPRIKRFTAI